MLEKERKTREPGRHSRLSPRPMAEEGGDSMEQFEVAGISQTHDEMVRKIEE